MSKQHLPWLYRELPTLVEKGILSASAAAKVRAHYGEPDTTSGRNWAVALFGIIGAVLVGAGVLLLLAHNWDQFSRPVRTMLAFLPLLAGQVLGLLVLLRKTSGVGAREGVAVFILLALGACVAMVSQIYHLSDDFSAFLLTWMLLSWPLVYVFNAVVPAVLYLAGLTAWAVSSQSAGGQAAAFWPLAALLAPVAWVWIRENRFQPRVYVLFWGSALCLCVATGVSMEKILPGLWIIVYAALLSLLYLAGSFWFKEAASWWQKPLQMVGGIGSAILIFLLSFQWPWESVGWHFYRAGSKYHEWASAADYVLAVALPIAAVCLWATCIRRGRRNQFFLGAFPVVAVLGYAAAALTHDELLPALLLNVYLLALALHELVGGFRTRRSGQVNGGMLLLSALIVARFFDSDLDFLLRGLVFILLGIGFFVVNLVLLRRKGRAVP